MAEIVTIHGGELPTCPNRQSAIDLLEATLAEVRKGEVIAIGMVTVFRDGGVGTTWSDGNCYHQMNSGAATLSARLARGGEDA